MSYGFEDRIAFDHVDLNEFVVPAYEQAKLSEPIKQEDFWPIHTTVYYATQLAVGMHRPDQIRQEEDTVTKARFTRAAAEREERQFNLFGDNLPKQVQFAGLNWPGQMLVNFADSLEQERNMPVLTREEADRLGDEAPERYRTPDGNNILRVSNEAIDQLRKMKRYEEPYAIHSGYDLGDGLDYLYEAASGHPSTIRSWDRFPTHVYPPDIALKEDYAARYEERFTPGYFVYYALTGIANELDWYGLSPLTAAQAGTASKVAGLAVRHVLEKFADGTRERHSLMVYESGYDFTEEDEKENTDEPDNEVQPGVTWKPIALDHDMISKLTVDMARAILDDARSDET